MDDPKIALKAYHTKRVAALADRIARSLSLPEADVDLAWLSGMLHDVGRFEQIRRFGTFSDAASVSHAKLSGDILFTEGHIRDYLPERNGQDTEGVIAGTRSGDKDADIDTHIATSKDRCSGTTDSDLRTLELAVRLHSDFALPEALTERERMFAQILRDADKIDIYRVQHDTPLEDIYNLPEESFYTDPVSPVVLEDALSGRNVLRAHRKTAVDYLIGHISLIYGIVYEESLKIVLEQGYFRQLLHFGSRSPKAQRDLSRIRAYMKEYLRSRGVPEAELEKL